jgi:hypothetical protein
VNRELSNRNVEALVDEKSAEVHQCTPSDEFAIPLEIQNQSPETVAKEDCAPTTMCNMDLRHIPNIDILRLHAMINITTGRSSPI